MTAAQRAEIQEMIDRYDHAVAQRKRWKSGLMPSQADALRAALGTCGTCKHLWKQAEGYGFCDAPEGLAGFPFPHYLMPLGERCTGYTPKEGA